MKALITGASAGIGKEIAYILSQDKVEILLVARNQEKLINISKEIPGSHFISADLSQTAGILKLLEYCEDKSFIPNYLINNAGIGVGSSFANQRLSSVEEMMFLNMNAIVKLTHHFIPKMKDLETAKILNVGSTAAYQAMPGLAAYAATKSFVLSFSRALQEELKDTNITVSTLSPGPTRTDFISSAGFGSEIQKQAKKFEMSAKEVAHIAVKGLYENKKEIIPGLMNYFSTKIIRAIPRTPVERIVKSIYFKDQ